MVLVAAILLAAFVLPPVWGLAAVLAGGLVEVGEAAFWFRWSRRRRPQVGAETLLGETGTVVVACLPDGQVSLGGELWRARCEPGANEGETVSVVGREGLTLVVEPRARGATA